MQLKPNRLWLTALLLGWLFDLLFWKQLPPGISFAIYVSLTLGAGFVLLRQAGIPAAKWTLALVLPILFFACMTFTRQEPLSVFLAYLSTFLLMAVFVVTFQGGRWISYGIADYFVKAIDLMVSTIARPLSFMLQAQQPTPGPADALATEKHSSIPVWGVVRGLLLAVPVLAVFIALFSSADPIFAGRVQGMVTLFRLENLPEYIFRVIYIGFLAYALAGIFLHAAGRSSDEKLLGRERPFVAPFFGFTEAAVVLGSVILLFGLFVSIQFQYFFGGQANIHVEGFTYAEYVHRGFGELVTVAFFALLLFLGLSAVVRRETPLKQKAFSVLGLLLFTLVALILLSAYQRLALYEAAYGFTRLRTYIHVFIVWVALLLAVVVVLDLLRRQHAFALAAMLASLGFAATLMLMNVDGFIVSQNVQRLTHNSDLDVSYLATLSPDAVPTLVSLYRAPALAASTHDQLGAALACLQAIHDQNFPPALHGYSWQSFSLSDFWSQAGLAAVHADLKVYSIDGSDYWTRQVTTPLGRKYDCYGSSGD